LVILGSLAMIVHRYQPMRHSSVTWAPLGQLAAREVAELVHGHGKIAAVLFDTRRIGMQGQVSAFESFQTAVKSNPGLTLAVATIIQPVQLDKSGALGFTVQQVQELAKSHAGADLIVCFGGASFVNIEKLDWDAARNPRLVSVMSLMQPQLLDLFARQILALSISMPLTANEIPAITRHEGGFTFQVITPENAADVLRPPPAP